MTRLFDQQKAVFLEMEREMTADGLLRMSPAVFTEMARNPTIAPLPSNQATKYRELLDQAQIFVSVIRSERATEFELMIENVGPRLYLPRFVHATVHEPLPECAADMDQMHCGSCAIRLERGWMLEYSWFPADPDEEASRC